MLPITEVVETAFKSPQLHKAASESARELALPQIMLSTVPRIAKAHSIAHVMPRELCEPACAKMTICEIALRGGDFCKLPPL